MFSPKFIHKGFVHNIVQAFYAPIWGVYDPVQGISAIYDYQNNRIVERSVILEGTCDIMFVFQKKENLLKYLLFGSF